MIRGASETRRYLKAIGIEAPIDIRNLLGREPNSILVVGMRRIGDLIVILPAIQSLRDNFPHAQITIMSASDHETLLRGQPYLDDFEPLPEDERDFHSRAQVYDLVISFRNWHPPPRNSSSFPLYYFFSTKLLVGPPKRAHLHYLDALRLLGLKPRVRRPRLMLDPQNRIYARRFFAAFDFDPKDLVVAVHAGSSYEGKQWPSERYSQVLEWLQQCYDARFVVIQGRDSDNLVNEVTARLKEDRVAILGEAPLLHVAAVLARCAFYLGNDSGVMHLADAVGIPTLVIFGPSRPGVWGGTGRNSVHLVREDIWHSCPYCSGRHLKDIPCEQQKDQYCLRAIRVEDVLAALESLAALIQLRKRFEQLDGIRVTDNLMCASFDSSGLVLANLCFMRPLFVRSGGEQVKACIDAVVRYGSYTRVVQMRPDDQTLLEVLLTYRIILPKSDGEKLLDNDVREARTRVLGHPLVANLSLSVNGTNTPINEASVPHQLNHRSSLAHKRPTKQRLRVLFVNSIHPSIYGGGERWMLKVGRALADRGHQVLCWGLSQHRWLADAQQQGLLCLTRPVPLTLDLHELAALVHQLQRLRLDAALLNLDRDVNSLGLPLRLAKVPIVLARKGLSGIDENPVTRWAYSQVIDGIITPSERIRHDIIGEGWLGPDDVRVIPNGVDVAKFDVTMQGTDVLREDLDLSPDAKVILTIGRLTIQKGAIHLMRALPAILKCHPQARFLIVGGGPTEDKLRIKVVQLGLDWAVRFLGERWDAERMLSLADCFVLPSRYEGMSTALLEAMASGVPVVATAVYGATEIITDGVTGVLVPPGNSIALAKAVCHILDDGTYSTWMANKAREHVRSCYSFKAMIDDVENVLRSGL